MFSHGSSLQLNNSTAVVTHFLEENDYIVKKIIKTIEISDKKIPALQNTPTFH